MQIMIDDLSGAEIAGFLQDHLEDMKAVSPPESKHALDLDNLRQADITFWSARIGGELVGCAALKELNKHHAEIKSMRTSSSQRGQGIGSLLLQYLLQVANQRQYQQISLETGSMRFFEPARRLYQKFGFDYCQPFATYQEDPNSVFMTRML